MRCLIINCLHSVRSSGSRSNSWNLFQICPCCAYEMHKLNPFDKLFQKFRTKSIKVCLIHQANRKHKKPYTNYILEILLVRPSTKTEIQSILKEAFNIKLTIDQINHSANELKYQNLIRKEKDMIYPVKDLIEVTI